MGLDYSSHLILNSRIMDKSKSASMVYDKIVNQYAESFHEPSDHIDEFLKYLPTQ
ncbi:MAG: hypothetical protein WC917_03910 [Bacilli bacterium]